MAVLITARPDVDVPVMPGWRARRAGARGIASLFSAWSPYGHTREECAETVRADRVLIRAQSSIVFAAVPQSAGLSFDEDNVRMLKGEGKPRSFTKDGRVREMATGSVQDLIDAGRDVLAHARIEVYDQSSISSSIVGGMAETC